MALVTQTSYGEYTYMGINLKKGVPTEVNNKSALEYFATLPGFKIEGKAEEAKEPGKEGETQAEEAKEPGKEGETQAEEAKEPGKDAKTTKSGKKPPLKA